MYSQKKSISANWCLFFLFFNFFNIGAWGEQGRKYLNIGADPKNPFRQLAPDEMEQKSTIDTYVVIDSKSGKVSRGWVRAGEVFVTIPTKDNRCPYEKCRVATWIKKCGNELVAETSPAGQAPIFFKEPKPPSLSTTPILPPAPTPVSTLELETKLPTPPTPSEQLSPPLSVPAPPILESPKKEKKVKDEFICLGVDTVFCSLGTGALSGGIASGNVLLLVAGGVVSVAACSFNFGHHIFGVRRSDPRCLNAAMVAGGLAGYFGGKRSQASSSPKGASVSASSPRPPRPPGPVSPMP